MEKANEHSEFLSSSNHPGRIQWRSNPNKDSDCDYFTCPNCGKELYSSWIFAWTGIECYNCTCTFVCIDDLGGLWEFKENTIEKCSQCGKTGEDMWHVAGDETPMCDTCRDTFKDSCLTFTEECYVDEDEDYYIVDENIGDIAGNYILTFGKHKGMWASDVPSGYLKWLANQNGRNAEDARNFLKQQEELKYEQS